MTVQQIATMPAQILFEKWSQVGFNWQGTLPIDHLSRLYEQTDTTFQAGSPVFHLDCTLKKTNGIVWLCFDVQGTLWLTCHRCLSPLAFDVLGAYRMAILTDESKVDELWRMMMRQNTCCCLNWAMVGICRFCSY